MAERPLPPRVTMPLLALVTESSMDEDYRQVAERRTAVREAPPAAPRHRGAAVVVAIFGILVATAAVQTSRNADVDSASRTALTDRIDQREEAVASLQGRIEDLESQNTELNAQFQRLGEPLRTAQARLRTLEVATGFGIVQGPGIRVTVEDAPSGDVEGRVRATDLRLLVNGLWEAGAEAIAINGRRLTALSAIVNAGIAVKVNRAEITPPYVVSAIGDRRTLPADLLTTTSGISFHALADQFGFVVQRENVDSLTLPAAPAFLLRLRWGEASVPGNPQEEAAS